jgi:hypothetical protein
VGRQRQKQQYLPADRAALQLLLPHCLQTLTSAVAAAQQVLLQGEKSPAGALTLAVPPALQMEDWM